MHEFGIMESALALLDNAQLKTEAALAALKIADALAESHADDAFRVNETGARLVAEAAAMQGAPVVYFSTLSTAADT